MLFNKDASRITGALFCILKWCFMNIILMVSGNHIAADIKLFTVFFSSVPLTSRVASILPSCFHITIPTNYNCSLTMKEIVEIFVK